MRGPNLQGNQRLVGFNCPGQRTQAHDGRKTAERYRHDGQDDVVPELSILAVPGRLERVNALEDQQHRDKRPVDELHRDVGVPPKSHPHDGPQRQCAGEERRV